MAYCERLRPGRQRSSQGVILSIICVNAVVPLLSIITDILNHLSFFLLTHYQVFEFLLTSPRHLLAFVPLLLLSLSRNLFPSHIPHLAYQPSSLR
ncbi:hypothetical protein BDV32DRAFT_128274 [Aspergillus pseudonomiae]|nr:hypothetical protein BDV32DRAFT_128274 [Aspergillus pseudonomiae]